MSNPHFEYIRTSFRLAEEATEERNHPFGALAVLNGQVIATAKNSVVVENDSTRHAELNLVSNLSRNFSRDFIRTLTLYCSTEPCTMCAAALFWAGCRHVVFGCSAATLGIHTTNSFSVGLPQSLSAVIHHMKIEGPFLEHEGESLHINFWKNYRGKK